MIVLQYIMLCLLVGGSVVYCAACLIAFSGHFRRIRKVEGFLPAVSIVISARNEEDHIGFLLDDLIHQDYPEDRIRIVVVDDCSVDGTVRIVKKFMVRDNRIQLCDTRNSLSQFSHKKRAVHEGIIATDSEIIMTTDADCRVSSGWVNGMIEHFVPGVDLVAGMVIVEGGGLFGCLEALEFTGIQAMASGLMNAGFPVTCNGANLAYRRGAFERVDGFDGVGNVVSGDDDLLMQKIAAGDASRVVYVMENATSVRTGAADNPSHFLNQRARWASKIVRYPSLPAVALMSAFFAFFAVIPLWLILAFLKVVGFTPLFIVYGFKITGDMLLTVYGVCKNRRPELMFIFPLAEIFHVPYILGVTVRGFFGLFEWHGRRTGSVNLEYGKNAHD